MIYTNQCPRSGCGGTILVDIDMYGPTARCLHCGFEGGYPLITRNQPEPEKERILTTVQDMPQERKRRQRRESTERARGYR